METKDVTEEWIKKNFDINKERRVISKDAELLESLDIDDVPLPNGVDDFLIIVREIAARAEKKFLDNAKHNILSHEITFDIRTKYIFGDYETCLEIRASYTYEESDDEVISRLKKRERNRIASINKELKQLERLKSKYE